MQLLVTSFKVSATSFNLQKDCADVVFVDVPSNAPSIQQAAGRVIRIGQQLACTIYIITTDHSYDQVLQAAAAREMIGVIVAYNSRTIFEDEIKFYQQAYPDRIESDDEIRDALIDESMWGSR